MFIVTPINITTLKNAFSFSYFQEKEIQQVHYYYFQKEFNIFWLLKKKKEEFFSFFYLFIYFFQLYYYRFDRKLSVISQKYVIDGKLSL